MDLPADLAARYPGAVAFRFGDGEALCRELTQLVIDGHKTASCGAASAFEGEGAEAPPVPGRRDVALWWDGTPAVVIETVSVERMAFRDVPEDFALAEGEGDFDDWRRGHEAYFARNGGFDPGMPLLCERFRVVEVL